jgi:hypothetical protein
MNQQQRAIKDMAAALAYAEELLPNDVVVMNGAAVGRWLLEQPEPVQEPVAWQPIATAPQDGTKILGWNEEFGARETQMTFYGEGSPGFAAWKSGKGPKESGWNWSEPKSSWSHTWKPTHWKPLLTPFNTAAPEQPAAWVDLTDEDIEESFEYALAKYVEEVDPDFHSVSSQVDYVFARAIEQRLKEKNT